MNHIFTPGVLIAGSMIGSLVGGEYGVMAFLATTVWISIKFID